MSKRTKKVGSSGRLGARYGVRVRKRIADVESVTRGRHECPRCKTVAMSRIANGIWLCSHCGANIASSSYMPTKPVAVRREIGEVLAEAESKEAEETEETVPEAEETEEMPAPEPRKPRKRKE